MNREEAFRVGDTLREPLGRSFALGVRALPGDQRGEPRTPLVESLRDARPARGGLPARDSDIAVALACLLRQPAVREECEHVPTAQPRVDQVDQREDAPADRPLGDRRAVVEVDGESRPR